MCTQVILHVITFVYMYDVFWDCFGIFSSDFNILQVSRYFQLVFLINLPKLNGQSMPAGAQNIQNKRSTFAPINGVHVS